MTDDQKNAELEEDLELEDDAAEKVSGGSAVQDDINIGSFSLGSSSTGGTSGSTGGKSTHGPSPL